MFFDHSRNLPVIQLKRPSLDQIARDALEDFGVIDANVRIGIGEAQNHEEPIPT